MAYRALKKKKKGIWLFYTFLNYGRFLSTMIVMAKPIAIAIIMAAAAAAMYISMGGKVVTGFGDGVGAVWSTAKDVIAWE